MHRKPLSEARRYYLLGLLNILEKAPGNGAVAHATAQLITALRIHLSLNLDIPDYYEEKIKITIRRLYQNV